MVLSDTLCCHRRRWIWITTAQTTFVAQRCHSNFELTIRSRHFIVYHRPLSCKWWNIRAWKCKCKPVNMPFCIRQQYINILGSVGVRLVLLLFLSYKCSVITSRLHARIYKLKRPDLPSSTLCISRRIYSITLLEYCKSIWVRHTYFTAFFLLTILRSTSTCRNICNAVVNT